MKIKKALVLSLIIVAIVTKVSAQTDNLEKCFMNPPESAAPWVYWYWVSGHITKEGITKDLEAMKQAGIGEAFISNVHDDQITPGDVRVLSEEWWDCMVHAVREAGRIGVKIGLFNCPGWSMSGGPWVGSDRTMRYLVSSETTVTGGKRIELPLTAPEEIFQQVSVQAFPTPVSEKEAENRALEYIRVTPAADQDPEMLFNGNPDGRYYIREYPVTFDIKYEKTVEVRSLKITPAELPMNALYELQFLDRNNYWTTLAKGKIDRQIIGHMAGPMTFGTLSESFPAVRSKQFRILLTDGGETLPWVRLEDNEALGCLSGIELSDRAVLAHYNEKQMGKLAPTPHIHWDSYLWDDPTEPESESLSVARGRVIDLTDKVDEAGVLRWEAPEGEWTILRTGMSPTGSKNHPVTPECEGWEIDKMNKVHTQYHYDQYVGELLRRLTPRERRAVRHVVMDSYEQGSQNWTDGMTEVFRQRYGYDPVPWFPVLTGRIVESAEKSDRFLWDLRRLTADLIASEYVTGMREKANADGMRLWCENYGFGFPGESLMYGGATDDVAGEFWNSSLDLGPMECRIASSCANIYGKKTASAEAFTSHWTLTQMPSDMKAQGDWALCQGINHFVFHLYIHQAYDRKPGINAWFGSDFNRNSTWFLRAKPYYDYLRRASAMLQQGVHAADILYYYGEDTPKQTTDFIPAPRPGFDFDLVNAEILLNDARVENGRIVLRTGASYAVLVLPRQQTMRPELLGKIKSLVNDGAVIVGPRPEKSPSLENYPVADRQVREMAGEIWQDIDGVTTRSARFGRGRVYSNMTLEEIFAEIGLGVDIRLPDDFLYIHRRTPEAEIYFVSNQSAKTFDGEIGFSVTGRCPELWDAVSGERRPLPEFSEANGMTSVPMILEPGRSWFVVFREGSGKTATGKNFPEATESVELAGPWSVAFDPALGAPAKTEFPALQDWTQHTGDAIRFYAGTAVYTREFQFDASKGETRYYLNLGEVAKLAEVRVNGKSVGTAWCAPYRLEITGPLKKGRNTLEIAVTNPWFNRVVGDVINGTDYTWLTLPMPWAKDSPLIPSGLIGPVKIEAVPVQ